MTQSQGAPQSGPLVFAFVVMVVTAVLALAWRRDVLREVLVKYPRRRGPIGSVFHFSTLYSNATAGAVLLSGTDATLRCYGILFCRAFEVPWDQISERPYKRGLFRLVELSFAECPEARVSVGERAFMHVKHAVRSRLTSC